MIILACTQHSRGAPKERKPAPARSTESRRGEQSDDNFLDLHVGNLPSMRSPEDQEMMRKRLMDLFQPYGAIQVRVFHREKDFGWVTYVVQPESKFDGFNGSSTNSMRMLMSSCGERTCRQPVLSGATGEVTYGTVARYRSCPNQYFTGRLCSQHHAKSCSKGILISV